MGDSWEKPVTIIFKGDTRHIASTMDAADCLFSCCRKESGPLYDRTMRCFAQVFDERQPPTRARDAFVELIESSPAIIILSTLVGDDNAQTPVVPDCEPGDTSTNFE